MGIMMSIGLVSNYNSVRYDKRGKVRKISRGTKRERKKITKTNPAAVGASRASWRARDGRRRSGRVQDVGKRSSGHSIVWIRGAKVRKRGGKVLGAYYVHIWRVREGRIQIRAAAQRSRSLQRMRLSDFKERLE